jgi:hypothetical protein
VLGVRSWRVDGDVRTSPVGRLRVRHSSGAARPKLHNEGEVNCMPQTKTAGAVFQQPYGRPQGGQRSARLAQAEATVREGARAAVAIKTSQAGNRVRK